MQWCQKPFQQRDLGISKVSGIHLLLLMWFVQKLHQIFLSNVEVVELQEAVSL